VTRVGERRSGDLHACGSPGCHRRASAPRDHPDEVPLRSVAIMGAVTTTCLVHDDRPQARRRLEALVRSVAGMDAVLAARDADDLLQRVVACPGAMVVVGLADAAPTGVETVRRVLGCAPGAAVLVAGLGGRERTRPGRSRARPDFERSCVGKRSFSDDHEARAFPQVASVGKAVEKQRQITYAFGGFRRYDQRHAAGLRAGLHRGAEPRPNQTHTTPAVVLGVRFCTATMSSSLTRGCICR